MTQKPINYTTRKPIDPAEVRARLVEQLNNCVGFANCRSGTERDGWLDDADFYSSAIALIDRALSPALVKEGVVETKRNKEWLQGYRCAWKDAITAILDEAEASGHAPRKRILRRMAWLLGEFKHKQKREPMNEELETYSANPSP